MGKGKADTAEANGQIDTRQITSLLDRLGAGPGSNLMVVLHEAQDHFGYLPPAVLEQIADRLKIPLSRVYGVVSFYAHFRTAPRGRHVIRCCRGTVCHVRGSRSVLDTIRRELGIDDGQTTDDKLFTLETVECLGTCFLAPVMMIDGQYYGRLTPRRVVSILRSYGHE